MHNFALLVQLGQNPVANYWRKLVGPDPFRGLYHLDSFDLAVMIPYFLVLAVLAMYGLHRYWLVYEYFKYKENVPGPPPEIAAGWPKVTIQLPSRRSAGTEQCDLAQY